MALDRLLNVARKEFSDHITSRRFVIILALFLVISAVSIHDGIENYNNSLESYNEQLQRMEEFEDPYSSWMPEKPSIMYVFISMMSYMTALGGILALAIGFDLVSKEKESRSLKTLLSHPIYRDEIINGKVLGGVGALGFAMALSLAIAIAMLLIFSVVPTVDEFAAILVFGAASLGLLLAYFAIALTMSTVAKESGNALIYTLVIFAIVSSLLPMLGMMAADALAGDPPEAPEMGPMGKQVVGTASSGGYFVSTASQSVVYGGTEDPAWREYEEEMKTYIEKRRFINDISNLLSPQMNYYTVAMAVTNPRIALMISSYTDAGVQEEPGSLAEALGRVWMNIAALIVFPSVFFAATYVKFMRMDIR
ncbi:MAG: ABC transporter permease subunit [Methanoculleus sp.]|uniref:ABC transporter permease n=1 Tax=unclassified Methanoculleus TaxID=2619537 RepID=UPI0025EF013A|nr:MULTISPECIES: ABC transporter permease subunit [unclassified Methanoculleus]MCK9318285.1 ABC transporter permease [Methanoculleus sp.]MDD2253607.1 ABC transporter permease subunit [Methanoculleus sp.]MDD3216541.1 ABC transporter permease subunit [Methanoculleus sp.]MDD4314531.1 ABC transporter permease subunit [Methanoculleus sp.]MDD4470431.1 ABC transporter permease subunit [Methanoculleus sp.]